MATKKQAAQSTRKVAQKSGDAKGGGGKSKRGKVTVSIGKQPKSKARVKTGKGKKLVPGKRKKTTRKRVGGRR